MWYPFGEQLMELIGSVCPIHCNGGTGQVNNSPLCILMVLVNCLLKMLDNGDCDGRKGPVEI